MADDDAPARSAEVLGRLLVIQQTLDAMPTEARLAEFTRQALMTLPGVGQVAMFVCELDWPAGRKLEAIRAEWARERIAYPPPDPAARRDEAGSHYYPLAKAPHLYGFLLVLSADEARLVPYLDLIANVANSIGNVLDSRLHHTLLSKATGELRARTHELQAINRQLQAQIRERERAQAELAGVAQDLKRSNAELEQLAYVASHDLQEPLRMIASYLQLLEKKHADQLDAEAHEFIAFAVDGAKRMQALINDLLTYSRVGNLSMPTEPTDTDKVLDAALRSLRVTIEQSGARIERGELPPVQGNAAQLAQLFQNLVANAIKFQAPGRTPQVSITAEAQDGQWCFSVRDNGIGIEPDYFDRIFVMFQRLHGRSSYPGTGIGLAVCKKIVERHGGRIWVESQPGQGTVFRFTLPKARGHDD